MLLFPKPFIPISDSGFQESKERIRGATWAGGMTANSTASPENWPEIFIDSTTRTNKDSQLAVHSTVGKREPELDVSELSKASEPVAKSRERARGLNLDFANIR